VNGVCDKRLVPFLPELVPSLVRHGHLSFTAATREALRLLSPATADRLLWLLRQPHGVTTTMPGLCSRNRSQFGRSLNDRRPAGLLGA
jgi:hypothetical protein